MSTVTQRVTRTSRPQVQVVTVTPEPVGSDLFLFVFVFLLLSSSFFSSLFCNSPPSPLVQPLSTRYIIYSFTLCFFCRSNHWITFIPKRKHQQQMVEKQQTKQVPLDGGLETKTKNVDVGKWGDKNVTQRNESNDITHMWEETQNKMNDIVVRSNICPQFSKSLPL